MKALPRMLNLRLAIAAIIVAGCITFLVSELHLIAHILEISQANGGVRPDGAYDRAVGSAAARTTRKTTESNPADAIFNGARLALKRMEGVAQTNVRCVGDTFDEAEKAWMYRSCHFDLICFNTTSNDYVVFESSQSGDDEADAGIASSDSMINKTVSIGGINQKWGTRDHGIPRMEWFPKIVAAEKDLTYYQLPDEAIWLPLHSLNSENPGHLVWDDFLPAYTLLDMFNLVDRHPLLLRYVLNDNHPRGMWGACDLRDKKTAACSIMMKKFVPLMFGLNSPWKYTSSNNYTFLPQRDSAAAPELICGEGVAGAGALTDHGTGKSHGWETWEYEITHNTGRGGLLFGFRNFMMRNMGLPERPLNQTGPHRIVFSLGSSRRSIGFKQEMKMIEKNIPNIVVEGAYLSKMSLRDQLELASSAAVFITLCGGGAVTAMFASRGASVIVFYSETGGMTNGKYTKDPARLDWDLLNAMSHLRVHWLRWKTTPFELLENGCDEKNLRRIRVYDSI